MADDVVICRICKKHPAKHRDYRFIDSCGMQGSVLDCDYCFGLDDEAIRQIKRENLDPKTFYEKEELEDKSPL